MNKERLYSETFYKDGKEGYKSFGVSNHIQGAESLGEIADYIIKTVVSSHHPAPHNWIPLILENMQCPELEVHKAVSGDGHISISLRRGLDQSQLEELAKLMSLTQPNFF